MNRKFRLLASLGIALVLCSFMMYTALASSSVGEPVVQAWQLPQAHQTKLAEAKDVELVGIAAGPIQGDGSETTMHFYVSDGQHHNRVPVSYQGAVPDSFKVDRSVVLTGKLVNGVFVGKRDSLVTKCPSKYAAGINGPTGKSA